MNGRTWRMYVTATVALGLAAVAVGQTRQTRKTPPPRPKPIPAETARRPARRALPASNEPRVVFEIALGRRDWGRVVIELNSRAAPQTVNNFLRYVESGYYDDTIFHRVIQNFVVQGGAYTTPTKKKAEGVRGPIRNESQTCGLRNERGTIAMARSPRDPHSATTQFLINVKDNPGLDPDCAEGDGWGYCVFGKVIEGQNIVDQIKNVSTRYPQGYRGEKSLPIAPPKIKRAYRLNADGTPPAVSERTPRGQTPRAVPARPEPAAEQPGQVEPAPPTDPDPVVEPVEPEPEPVEPEPMDPDPDPEPVEPEPEWEAALPG
jgi:peptidyl-prolyl cis-trans isomerase B (cyclophilin B)